MLRGYVQERGKIKDSIVFELFDGVKAHYCLADHYQYIENNDILEFKIEEKIVNDQGKYKNIPLYVIPTHFSVEMPESDDFIRETMQMIYRNRAVGMYNDLVEEAESFESLSSYLYKECEKKFKMGELSKIFYWWLKHRVHRRLWHLGLKNVNIEEAIDYYHCSKADLYNEIRSHPLNIITLSVEHALALCKRFSVSYTPDELRAAHISRYIYNQTICEKHTHTPLSIINKKFPDSNKFKDIFKSVYQFIEINGSFQLPYVYDVENGIVSFLKKIQKRPVLQCRDIKNPLVKLNKYQQQAVEKSIVEPILIITGGPGRGKTKVINEIVRNIEGKETYCLISYMGKAVARIREVTGSHHAATADHFILSSVVNPVDVIIWDEISMAHASLVFELLKKCEKINNNRLPRIIFVGDANQLQPTKWGCFFHQILKLDIPTICFRRNYRAKNKLYMIDENEDLIPMGPSIFEKGGVVSVVRHYKKIIDSGISPRSIVVLTTTNKVAEEINMRCQILNKSTEFVIDSKLRKFMVTDPVILKQNNYESDLWNGDLGTIIDIDKRRRMLYVEFKNRTEAIPCTKGKDTSAYNFYGEEGMTSNSLKHAYCLTIHSSQGSEWPYVIFYIPEDNTSLKFFNFYMINTAISRAMTKLIIIGDLNKLQTYIKLLPPEPRERVSLLMEQE